VVAGQPLGALPAWLVRWSWIVEGYGAAMQLEDPTRSRDRLVVGVLVAWLAVGTALTATSPRRRRASVGAVLAMTAFLAFRQGFTRHDHLHVLTPYLVLVVVGVTLVAAWGTRRAAAFTAAALVALFAVVTVNVARVIDPARLPAAQDSVDLATDRARQAAVTSGNREELRRRLCFDAALVAPAVGRTVHVSPWETSAVYAYPDLRWRPLPVFQDYSAYTAELDQLNVAALAGDRRPDFILRKVGVAVDVRVARWEPPAATLEMVCRYREIRADGSWKLLEATANRCGAPAVVARGEGRFGAPISVPTGPAVQPPPAGAGVAAPPAGDGIVVARFSGVGTSFVDRARTALFRARDLWVRLDDRPRNRFVPGTQGSWHVVRAPECARRILDGAPDIDSITFSTTRDAPAGDEPLAYEMAVVPFTC
jgi:hypothetical protein